MSHALLQPVLFGAFDRHNFGDMLFAHILPQWHETRLPPLFAGVVEADLRPQGGHRVESLSGLLARLPGVPLHLIHAGGELLVCDRWVARITSLAGEQAELALKRYDRDPAIRAAWLDAQPGFSTPAPYVVRRADLPPGSKVEFRAVGGAGLASLDESMRAHVFAALRQAERVSVRDSVTLGALASAGIDTALECDPVTHVRERHAEEIARRAALIGDGHIALQVGGEWSDDASLDALAAAIRPVVEEYRAPLVLFRAGSATWHDDIGMLERLAGRLGGAAVRVFDSLDIWDICGLIASARGVVGSSLHVRIVAEAFGRASVSLLGDDTNATSQANKVRAYVGTWFADSSRLATLGNLGAMLSRALADQSAISSRST